MNKMIEQILAGRRALPAGIAQDTEQEYNYLQAEVDVCFAIDEPSKDQLAYVRYLGYRCRELRRELNID